MHRYEKIVLEILKQSGKSDEASLCRKSGLGRDEVLWALENLGQQGLVKLDKSEVEEVSLTDEGLDYQENGLPELNLLKRLRVGTVPASGMKDRKGMIGLQWAKKLGLISITNGNILLSDRGVSALEKGLDTQKLLDTVAGSSSIPSDKSARELTDELSKRGLITVRKRHALSGISITKKGETFTPEKDEDAIGSLDKSLITGRRWEGRGFKPYDINVPVEKAIPALRHPLAYTISKIREAYVANGFNEVSGPIIDSAFWVFDSLFEPQDHPARDVQDTFYIANAEEVELGSDEYVKRVKKAHTQGWHYRWNLPTAKEAVLRTHTTSISARYIYDIVSDLMENRDSHRLPIKIFSMGRIFRNENIDYKHLADFYQTDGIVIGESLRLAHLFNTIRSLYSWLNMEIRFKPSYFPFVEPGAEFFAYSKKNKEWIELGGSGIIRREITGAKGNGISVLAWGVGVERLLLLQNENLKGISELYNNGLGWLRNMRY